MVNPTRRSDNERIRGKESHIRLVEGCVSHLVAEKGKPQNRPKSIGGIGMSDLHENEEKNVCAKSRVRYNMPQCKNKTYVSIHLIPKNRKLVKKWILACRIGKKLTSNMFVC